MAALNASKRIMASHENLLHLEKENKKKNGGWWHSNYNSLIKPDLKIHRILS